MRVEARTTVGRVLCLLGLNDDPDRDRTLASLVAPPEGAEVVLGPLLVSSDPDAELVCIRVVSRERRTHTNP